MKQLSIVLLMVFACAMLVAVPVSAAAPVFETFDFEEDSVVFPESTCGFEVRDHEVGTMRLTSYFDNDGNLLRIRVHISGVDTIYTEENPDIVLSGSFAGNGEVDLETGEIIFATGVPWHITAPGYGTVLVRAGRWLRYPDGQIAGKNSFASATEIAQLCEALSVAPSSSLQAAMAASAPHNLLFLPTVIRSTEQ